MTTTPGLAFTQRGERETITVVDSINRHRYTVRTSAPVSPTPTAPERFPVPVDAATTVMTDRLTLPTVVPVYVRDTAGRVLVQADRFATESMPVGTYCLELAAPIKMYVLVESALTVESDDAGTRVEFGERVPIHLGARVRQTQPTATVTTTDDPLDVMRAVSTFGAALKTTSPERSYPSLRDHPPRIERGVELSVPDGLSPPDTGLRIELPVEHASIYVAAPLAYYLGATLVPGDEPRIVADTGFEHPLATARGFEGEVERVLKQVLFFDCVTRTEGMYPVTLHERRAIEPVVDIDVDFATLYDRPLAERIETYLTVPFSVIEDALPRWMLTAYVEPVAAHVDVLPFVVNDLAVVRTPRERGWETTETRPVRDAVVGSQLTAVDDFVRTGRSVRGTTPCDGVRNESTATRMEAAVSIEQVRIGDGPPAGTTEALRQAYRNRLTRPPIDGDIDVTIVCNDLPEPGSAPSTAGESEMGDERDVVDAVYGSRAELPFDVTIHRDLSTEALCAVLGSPTDLLHYIGHVDADGFLCTDGPFDASALEMSGPNAFVLNACRSYEQGMALIDAGSIGGIVTRSEVIDSSAVRMGRTLARLLNRGFPLRAALDIAHDDLFVGASYTVIGDGGSTIAQAEGGTPNCCAIEAVGDEFVLRFETYPTRQFGMGSMVVPYLDRTEEYFLTASPLATFELSRAELRDFLGLETVPVRIDGDLRWSDEVTIDELTER